MANWPWSELGIRETVDRDEIHAAYRKKIDRLNISSPISAFTRLSEAREKALFLAAQRGVRTSDPAPFEAKANVDPLPEITEDAKPDSEVDQGAVGRVLVAKFPSQGLESARDGGRLSDLATRLDRLRLVIVLVFGAAYLIFKIFNGVFGEARISDWASPRLETREKVMADPETRQRLSAILPELFGPGYSIDDLAGDQRMLVASLANGLGGPFGESDLDNARSNLRTLVVHSRPSMSREMLLDASEVYLVWLKSADRAGDGSCRDVTGHSFYDGLPVLSDTDLDQEQAFLREFARSDAVEFDGDLNNRETPPIPSWAEPQAIAKSGLDAAQLNKALADLTDPNNCKAHIAVLETLLAQPKDAPRDLLEVI